MWVGVLQFLSPISITLSSPFLLFIYLFFLFLFFMGWLHGLWVAQLVGLVMGFGEFLIRVAVVFGGCWWFSVDMVGFFDGDCESITGLWFWWVVFLFPIVGGDEVVGLGLWFWWLGIVVVGGGGNGICYSYGGCWMVIFFLGGGGLQWLAVGVAMTVSLLE